MEVSQQAGERPIVVVPEKEGGAGPKQALARAGVLGLGLAGVLVLGFVTARVANAYPVSSDDATGVLEAVAVLEGNPMLKGWTVSNVSFLATDLPFYVAGVAIEGVHPRLLREVPSAVYAILVGIAVVLAANGRRAAGLAAATVVVLLALPAGGLAEFVTKGYTRVGTSIGFFGGLIALGEPAGRRVSTGRLALYAAVVGLTLFSDTYMLVLAVAPILIVCVMGLVRRESYENLGLGRIAGATCLAVLLALAGTRLVRRWEGSRLSHCHSGSTSRSATFRGSWRRMPGLWRSTCHCSIDATCRQAAGGWIAWSGSAV